MCVACVCEAMWACDILLSLGQWAVPVGVFCVGVKR